MERKKFIKRLFIAIITINIVNVLLCKELLLIFTIMLWNVSIYITFSNWHWKMIHFVNVIFIIIWIKIMNIWLNKCWTLMMILVLNKTAYQCKMMTKRVVVKWEMTIFSFIKLTPCKTKSKLEPSIHVAIAIKSTILILFY